MVPPYSAGEVGAGGRETNRADTMSQEYRLTEGKGGREGQRRGKQL